jgi:hypothetical protein
LTSRCSDAWEAAPAGGRCARERRGRRRSFRSGSPAGSTMVVEAHQCVALPDSAERDRFRPASIAAAPLAAAQVTLGRP